MKRKKSMLSFIAGTLLLLSLSFAGNAGAVPLDHGGGYPYKPICDNKGNCAGRP
ncbi:hypothetical protein [Sporosarcina limicola]|uniref:Uncharacterized protein n=1 Tax=Sporosarcina limicola TaxID=34101 RepID=A0A927MHK5_9BACL|nr:hypothetical protein [Sporosarcina limicola]MBE1553297.1 hypothetical protein [Sporosarcina limicola]